jgi:4-hydroxyphenylpyruvate dioxygenase-like putative hemolysin
MSKPLFNQVVQIGIVVDDAAATVCRYRELLGFDDWRFNEVDTVNGKGVNFRRGEHPVDARALIAWMPLGNVELELIEPRDETSVYAEFLRDKGPGIHHVMFVTPDYDHCVSQMTARGVSKLGSGELQDTRFQLFDTQAELGIICEIAAGEPLIPDLTSAITGR